MNRLVPRAAVLYELVCVKPARINSRHFCGATGASFDSGVAVPPDFRPRGIVATPYLRQAVIHAPHLSL